MATENCGEAGALEALASAMLRHPEEAWQRHREARFGSKFNQATLWINICQFKQHAYWWLVSVRQILIRTHQHLTPAMVESLKNPRM